MLEIRLVLMVLAVGLAAALEPRRKFDKDQLIRIQVETQEHLNILKSLEQKNRVLEFWRPPVSVRRPIDVHVPLSALKDFKSVLAKNGIQHSVLISNIQDVVMIERADMEFNREKELETNKSSVGSYHTLLEIYSWMDQLVVNNPQLVTKIQIGQTFEKRPLYALKFSTGRDRPAIWIEAGTSAREWISVATALWIGNTIGSNSKDRELSNLLNYMDILLVVVANPDGYEYSYTVDRLWSKTRSNCKDIKCCGVDLRRNWLPSPSVNIRFLDPCSSLFPGRESFSEVEVRNMSSFIQCHGNIKAFISLQSYSQSLMFPYGDSCKDVPNYQELMTVGRDAVQKLSSLYGTKYSVGSLCKLRVFESSSSIDWAYKFGIKYSFVLEVRGKNGFLVPYHQIIPTASETWLALKHIMAYVKDHMDIHMQAAVPIGV